MKNSIPPQILGTYIKIQTYMPEVCRFIQFQQSASTISRYMVLRIDAKKPNQAEITKENLVGIRVSDHKPAQQKFRPGISAEIPMYSINLFGPADPLQRCWVHGVLWLHEQAKQPVLSACRKAIWKHYLSFSLTKFKPARSKSFININKRCDEKTLKNIAQKLPEVVHMQRLLVCCPSMEQNVRFFLIDTINRMTMRFGATIKKKPGEAIFEKINQEVPLDSLKTPKQTTKQHSINKKPTREATVFSADKSATPKKFSNSIAWILKMFGRVKQKIINFCKKYVV